MPSMTSLPLRSTWWRPKPQARLNWHHGRQQWRPSAGTAFTQRPKLFGAVVCQVPLLDMLRYTKLLAGASWVMEYGDPEDPKMRDVIIKYSPYQNLEKQVDYPKVFFLTSTKDDRVIRVMPARWWRV